MIGQKCHKAVDATWDYAVFGYMTWKIENWLISWIRHEDTNCFYE